MNKIILKFILLFKSVFEKLGVDVKQLEIILLVKLTMDDRRAYSYMGRKNQQKKEHKNSSWLAMGMLLIMGFFMIFLLSMAGKSLLGNALYITTFIVLIAMTLVSDFTSVLIDVRDNLIILPRPVSDKTITVARILHISIHVSKQMISLTFPALVYLTYKDGFVGSIAFILEVFSATVFGIFLVNIIYLGVLKFSTPEKFKNVISYFQIVISVIIFAAFQILPRLIREFDISAIDPLSYWFSYFLPPVWFASFYDTLVHPDSFNTLKASLAALGLIVPFVSVFVVIKYLAPGFNRKLSAISGSGSLEGPVVEAQVPASRAKKSPAFAYKLSKIVTTHPVEEAGFMLTWWLSSRYRDFKLKAYPAFAYVPVYFVYLVFLGPGQSRHLPIDQKVANFKDGPSYIIITYLTSFILLTVLGLITQSEKYKAAWVMFSTPHNKPGKIVSGMYKAIVCKYLLPVYFLICIFSLYVWGYAVINDLFFAIFNLILSGMLFTIVLVKYLPFSQPSIVEGGKIFKNLLIMSLIGILGGLHYFLSKWEWVITPLAILSALACWMVYNYMQKRDWEALEADYG